MNSIVVSIVWYMIYSVNYSVCDVEIMILWYWIYIMNSTSGKDTVVSQMYMQSLTFTHAASLKMCMKKCMEVKTRYKRGFVPVAEAHIRIPICGQQKLQFYQKLFYFYT